MANLKRGKMLLETGATEIFSFYTDMLGLIDELGIKDRLVEVDAYLKFHIRSGDGEYDFNYGANPLTLLRNPALSMRSKLRLPSLLPDLFRFKKEVDPCFIETAAYYDDEDLNSYLTRKIGKDFVDGFVAPIFRLFWRWQPEDFSRAYFLAFFAHTLGCKVYTFRDGVGLLTRRLSKLVGVRYGCEVQNARTINRGSSVEVTYTNSDGKWTEQADVLISAVEAFRIPGLIPELSESDKEFFESVQYTQGVSLHYLLKTTVDPHSVIFAKGSTSPLLSFAQVPRNFPGFPEVPDRLWVSLTPEYLERYANKAGTNLDEIARPHVKALYPTLDEDLLEVQTQYEGYYLVLVYPGYIRKLKQFLTSKKQDRQTIHYCGDFLAHPHTGGACASGKRVATQIIEQFTT